MLSSASINDSCNSSTLLRARTSRRRLQLEECKELAFQPHSDLLAIGCSSRVYRAQLIQLGDGAAHDVRREVAVKTAEPGESFCHEYEMLQRLQGIPNVIECLHAVREGDAIKGLVFPLAAGTLDDLNHRLDGGMDMENVAMQLLQGMADMHARDIVHRDLKPQNILIVGLEPIVVKIADLGSSMSTLAAVDHKEDEQMGTTTAYTAPEVLSALKSNQVISVEGWKPADMYAVGVCLYVLYTKRVPFEALRQGSPVKLMVAAMHGFLGPFNPLPSDSIRGPGRLPILIRNLTQLEPTGRMNARQALDFFQYK
jgi:serine/threonine protein kinase